MRKIKAYRLGTDDYAEYIVPSLREAHAQMRATWGRQFDKIERGKIEGGIPKPFEDARLRIVD